MTGGCRSRAIGGATRRFGIGYHGMRRSILFGTLVIFVAAAQTFFVVVAGTNPGWPRCGCCSRRCCYWCSFASVDDGLVVVVFHWSLLAISDRHRR